MHVGELWQHRLTGEVVRIEMRLAGLLSFSILRGEHWIMCPHIWDKRDFDRKFRRIHPSKFHA